ncbi:MAG: hypothetical protein ACREJQ_08695 [bacterium]
MIVRVFPPIARPGEFVDMYVNPPWPENPKTDDRAVRVWFTRDNLSIPSPKVHPVSTQTFPAHVTVQLPSELPEGIFEPMVEWGGDRFRTSMMCCIPHPRETPATASSTPDSQRGGT